MWLRPLATSGRTRHARPYCQFLRFGAEARDFVVVFLAAVFVAGFAFSLFAADFLAAPLVAVDPPALVEVLDAVVFVAARLVDVPFAADLVAAALFRAGSLAGAAFLAVFLAVVLLEAPASGRFAGAFLAVADLDRGVLVAEPSDEATVSAWAAFPDLAVFVLVVSRLEALVVAAAVPAESSLFAAPFRAVAAVRFAAGGSDEVGRLLSRSGVGWILRGAAASASLIRRSASSWVIWPRRTMYWMSSRALSTAKPARPAAAPMTSRIALAIRLLASCPISCAFAVNSARASRASAARCPGLRRVGRVGSTASAASSSGGSWWV